MRQVSHLPMDPEQLNRDYQFYQWERTWTCPRCHGPATVFKMCGACFKEVWGRFAADLGMKGVS